MRRLEIGCGDTAAPGWERLDARSLPGVDHVQSAVDLSNFDDGTFDQVVAKDIVEHLPWRDVPRALAEWVRVVKPGGHLEVETPNALELAHLILNTPSEATQRRWNGEPDWARFARVAYGHQDYPENFHGCYFTPQWLTDLLLQAGAVEVKEVFCDVFRFRMRAYR